MDVDPAALRRVAALRHADVAGLTGVPFTWTVGDEVRPIVLAEVRDLSHTGDDPDFRAPFSMIFEETGAPQRDQGTYVVHHETLGTLALFLVPIGPGREGQRYEATFH